VLHLPGSKADQALSCVRAIPLKTIFLLWLELLRGSLIVPWLHTYGLFVNSNQVE
jgi:hypothetical protein